MFLSTLLIVTAFAGVQNDPKPEATAETSVTASEETGTVSETQQRTSASSAEEDGSRIKCRRLKITGSLIPKKKVCKTIDQWNEIARYENEEAEAIVGKQVTVTRGN